MRTVITIIMSLLSLVSCDMHIGDEPSRYTVIYYDNNSAIYKQYDNLESGSLLPVPDDPDGPFYGWVYYCLTDGVIDFSRPAGISEDDDGNQIVNFSMAAIPRKPNTTYVTYYHIFEENLRESERTAADFIEGETITFAPMEVENFKVAGWYLDEAMTIPAKEGDFIAQSDSPSIILYAYYEATIPIITVTYDQEGIEPVRLLSGSALKGHLDEAHEDGRFIAWYLDADLTERAHDDTIVESDTKLYARIVEAPQPISKVESFYLFNTGELFVNDMSRSIPVMDAVGSVLPAYDSHFTIFMEEDGYYALDQFDTLPGLLDDVWTAYPDGTGRVVDSCGAESFWLILDSAGKIYLKGDFNGLSHGVLESLDAFLEDYEGKAVRIETNGAAVGMLTDDGGLYILGFISNTSNPYISFNTFARIADDVVDFAFTTSAILYVTEGGALEHRGIDLGTLDVDNRQIEGSGVTSIYASMSGNDHNDFILYTKGDVVYVLGKYGINSIPKIYEKPTPLFEGYCKVTDFSRMPALFDAAGRLYMLGSLHDIQEDGYATVDEPYHVLPTVDFVSAAAAGLYGTYALSEGGDLWYFGETSSTYHQVREPFVVKRRIEMLSSELAVAADGTVYSLENHAKLDNLDASFTSRPIALKEGYVLLEDGTVYQHTTGWDNMFNGELTDFFYNGTYFAAVNMNRLESNFVEYNQYYPHAFERPIVKAVATENVELVLLDNGEVQWRGKGYRSASLKPLHDETEVMNQTSFTSLDTKVRFKDIMPVDYNDYGFFLLGENGRVYYLGDTSWVKGGCYQVNGMYAPKDLFDANVEIMKDGLFVTDECIYLEGVKNYEAEDRPAGQVISISAGRTVKCILETGELYTWGTNYAGECGNGESSYPSTPVLVDLDQWRL